MSSSLSLGFIIQSVLTAFKLRVRFPVVGRTLTLTRQIIISAFILNCHREHGRTKYFYKVDIFSNVNSDTLLRDSTVGLFTNTHHGTCLVSVLEVINKRGRVNLWLFKILFSCLAMFIMFNLIFVDHLVECFVKLSAHNVDLHLLSDNLILWR